MKYLLVVVTIFLGSCFGKKAEITGKEGQSLPEFNLLMTDSTYFNTKDLKPGTPTVFFIFSAFCPHCKSQLLSMIEDINSLKDTHIYMISQEPLPTLKQYYVAAKLDKYPNLSMGVDTSGFLGEYMHVKGIPYLAVYNDDKKLVKAYLGPTSASTIREALALKN